MTRKSALIGLAATAFFMLAGTATAAHASNDPNDAMVTDSLGTHASDEADMPPESSFARSQGSCGSWSEYGGGFHTSLGGRWTELAARSGPCRAGGANGSWGTGSRFYISRETNGEFICRSRAQGIGSNVWFKTDKGFSWSGGTNATRWQQGC